MASNYSTNSRIQQIISQDFSGIASRIEKYRGKTFSELLQLMREKHANGQPPSRPVNKETYSFRNRRDTSDSTVTFDKRHRTVTIDYPDGSRFELKEGKELVFVMVNDKNQNFQETAKQGRASVTIFRGGGETTTFKVRPSQLYYCRTIGSSSCCGLM